MSDAPRPSMFMAPREAKCSRPRRIFAGHDSFGQRHTTSSSSFPRALPHSLHVAGITQGCVSGGRRLRMGATTFGMTSPPFSITTVSPSRMSRRATSCALCSVAIEIVEPARRTGSRTANGVTAPVRPTLTSIRSSFVWACCAGNLKAVAHLGNFAVAPSRSRTARSSTLTTTPSVSNSRPCRLSAHSWQNAMTASMPSHRRQCGSTGSPHSRIAVSIGVMPRGSAWSRIRLRTPASDRPQSDM